MDAQERKRRTEELVAAIPAELSYDVVLALGARQDWQLCVFPVAEITDVFTNGFEEYEDDLTEQEIELVKVQLGWSSDPHDEPFWGPVWDLQREHTEDAITTVLQRTRPGKGE